MNAMATHTATIGKTNVSAMRRSGNEVLVEFVYLKTGFGARAGRDFSERNVVVSMR